MSQAKKHVGGGVKLDIWFRDVVHVAEVVVALPPVRYDTRLSREKGPCHFSSTLTRELCYGIHLPEYFNRWEVAGVIAKGRVFMAIHAEGLKDPRKLTALWLCTARKLEREMYKRACKYVLPVMQQAGYDKKYLDLFEALFVVLHEVAHDQASCFSSLINQAPRDDQERAADESACKLLARLLVVPEGRAAVDRLLAHYYGEEVRVNAQD